MNKDCRNCEFATLLEGKLEGWVSCKEFFGEIEIPHSPSYASIMCSKFK